MPFLALLPIIVFIVLVVLFYGVGQEDRGSFRGWRSSFLAAAITWGVFTAITSEALGLIKGITPLGVSLAWGLFLAFLLFYAWNKGILPGRSRIAVSLTGLRDLTFLEKLLVLAIAVFVLATLVVAWMSPPNTNDVLAYHLSRVMHWIQNRSLAHFVTPIERQLWMPPWAEMAMLQFQLLAGSDRFANLVQWFSMAGSLAGVSLIAGRLGASRKGQLVAALFCVTIPMGVLQATSAKNDYVTAFWAVCLAYFTVKAHQGKLAGREWALLSAAVALGILTKGTFYAYALPLLVWLLISSLRRLGWRPVMGYAMLGLLATIVLNAGAWSRNLSTYGSPLGPPDAVAAHANSRYNPGGLLANVMLNSTLHAAVPFVNRANLMMEEFTLRLVNRLGVEPGEGFQITSLWRSEDYAGNPLHYLFIIVFSGVLLSLKTEGDRRAARAYLLVVISAFFMYSVMYPWQPSGSRLQLPFFVLWSPLAGILIASLDRRWLSWPLAAFLVLAGLLPLVFNTARPIIPWMSTDDGIFSHSRSDLLFANSKWAHDGYVAASRAVNASGCTDVGLLIDSHDPEYPLWALISPDGKQKRLEHMDQIPRLAKYAPSDFEPCALLCMYCSLEREERYGLPFMEGFDGVRVYLSESVGQPLDP